MRSRVYLITFVYVCSVNYTSRCNNVPERDYVLIVGERIPPARRLATTRKLPGDREGVKPTRYARDAAGGVK